MALPDYNVDNDGVAKLPFSDAVLTRASGAWHPDDGKVYHNHKPRITTNRMPILKWTPRVLYSFDDSMAEMRYDTPLVVGDETFLERLTRFETEFPEFTRIDLGDSFSGRPMYAYRLGPVTRKHCVFTNVVHGNEHDGLPGAFKAMELLARTSDFQPFRDEWTIFFVPCMNPDGYKNDLRNLDNVGPNGRTVNLNRNFNWFWDEYVETASESKGSAAESEIEAQNFLAYWRTGNAGGPVTFGAMIDCHANEGEGVRYQSRDRIWRDIPNGPGSTPVGMPDGYISQYFDWYAWRIHSAMDTERYYLGEVPREMFVSYRRSRMLPHFHSYFSSQGVPTMIIEELKVDSAGGRETVKTASDFRMDYLLSFAAVCTADFWEWQDACLIEEGGTNILTNASWETLYTGNQRPSYYSLGRASPDMATGEVGIDDGGLATEITPSLSSELVTAEEYLCGCPDGTEGVTIVEPSTHKLFRIPDEMYSAADIHTLVTRTTVFGAAAVYAGPQTIDILGGGSSFATGAVNGVLRIASLDTTPTESVPGNIGTARIHAGYCDNFTSGITLATDARGYLVGGYDGAGTRLTSLGTWNPGTALYAASAQVLGTATAGSCCVWDPNLDTVWIFGGNTAAGMVNTIQKWVVGTDTLSTVGTAVLPTALAYIAGVFDVGSGKVYLVGGQDGSGDMNEDIFEFDPTTELIVTRNVYANLSDTEENEYTGDDAYWATAVGRLIGLQYLNEDGTYTNLFAGGRYVDTAGALSQDIYELDVPDLTISILGLSDYGYMRYSTAVDDEGYSVFYSDDFAAGLAGWTNPSGAWIDGGGYATCTSGTTGYLVLGTPPTLKHNTVSLQVGMTGSGASADFAVALRGTIAAGVLTDGYRVRYSWNGGSPTWYLERVVASAPTTISNYGVVADATKQITSVYRTCTFKCEETDPVNLIFIFNGYTIFDRYDFTASRIKTVGEVAVYGGST